MIGRLFKDHPASLGESYVEHARIAFGVGASMVGAGVACLLHGAFPFVFPTTASRTIRRLHARIAARAAKAGPATPVPLRHSQAPRADAPVLLDEGVTS